MDAHRSIVADAGQPGGFALPGYDVGELVGFGGSGEVWRAREHATGDIVALKRLRDTGRTGAAQFREASPERRLHREAALLASLRHEHVVRLRCVVPAPSGLVLVLDFAEGGSLAALLRARGTLSAGEVVTVAAPLAQALADAHGRGLTHGDVTPGNIVFDAAGKPLLTDLGVARLIGEDATTVGVTPGFADPAVVAGGAVTAASDLHGLAAVCCAALAGVAPYTAEHERREPLSALAPRAPAALVEAIESALDPDPRSRPAAAAFGRALYSACAPEPVRLVTGPPRPVVSEATHEVTPRRAPEPTAAGARPGQTPGRHRVRHATLNRRAMLVLIAVALLAAAAFAGVGWASRERSAAANAPAATAAPSASGTLATPAASAPVVAGDPEWIKVMAELDAARDQAFVDADASGLDGVYLPSSPALAADRRTLGELVAAGEHARGLAPRLASVTVETRTPTAVVLAVSDTLPSYDVVGPDGGVAAREPGRGERTWIVTLRTQNSGGPWLIDTIVAA